MESDKITMTDEEMIKDYTRLKLEYTRIHEDYRRLESKQCDIPIVSNRRELLKVLEYVRQIKGNPKEIQLIIDKVYLDNL